MLKKEVEEIARKYIGAGTTNYTFIARPKQ
jgi:hypothetical protein